jgi:hypothetical protein
MRRLFVFVTIAHLFFQLQSAGTMAQPSPRSQGQAVDKCDHKLRDFEQFVRQHMEKNKIPGMTIEFIKDDYV